eukprot:4327371-Amphidinium_carterae.1
MLHRAPSVVGSAQGVGLEQKCGIHFRWAFAGQFPTFLPGRKTPPHPFLPAASCVDTSTAAANKLECNLVCQKA